MANERNQAHRARLRAAEADRDREYRRVRDTYAAEHGGGLTGRLRAEWNGLPDDPELRAAQDRVNACYEQGADG